uniref:Uncharacterized protein n=1 Tax=Lotus japonicus TaxID=34305 RepID=I3SF64_LOTJA|nr:unknown [Lotus japonicus]
MLGFYTPLASTTFLTQEFSFANLQISSPITVKSLSSSNATAATTAAVPLIRNAFLQSSNSRPGLVLARNRSSHCSVDFFRDFGVSQKLRPLQT